MSAHLKARAAELLRAGWSKQRVSRELGIPRTTVRRLASKLDLYAAVNDAQQALHRAKTRCNATSAPSVAETLSDRVQRFAGDSGEVEVRVPRFIATLDEAIAASGVDTATWDVASWECRHYAMPTADGPIQASYVKLRLVKKTLAADPERIVTAVVKGLEAALPSVGTIVPKVVMRHTRPKVLRMRAINDLHFGGYAWSASTGGENWDIKTALSTATACNRYLDAQVPEDTTESLIWLGGDLAHFDTPHGTTTGGTQLDLDSRVDLMLAALSQYVVETISEEAERRPTTVILTEGNHDRILSKAIRRMLLLIFAKHKNVTVMEQYTLRQFHRYGGNLLGFAHGDRDKQRAVDAMALECGRLGIWDGAKCREYHTAHLHHEAMKQKVISGTESLHGTVVRTHIALTPADQYHADNVWVGGVTGMSDWYYHHKGAMIGNRVAISHLLDAA